MAIYIYAKQNDNIASLKGVLHYLENVSEFVTIIESTRSFNEYQLLKRRLKEGDTLIISTIFSLAPSQQFISNELKFFVDNKILLLIYEIEPTYKNRPTLDSNRGILETLSILASNDKVSLIALDKNYSVGRNKIVFPKNWDALYQQWREKKISSKEFIAKSGLKKASSYNMLSEYELLLKEQEENQKLA